MYALNAGGLKMQNKMIIGGLIVAIAAVIMVVGIFLGGDVDVEVEPMPISEASSEAEPEIEKTETISITVTKDYDKEVEQ